MPKASENARPLLVRLPFQVQTYDIDFASHVNNGVYVRWLEDLRLEVLRRYYPLKRLMDAGLIPVLTSSNVRYHHPVTLFDEPIGEMWAPEIGRATFYLQAEIRVGETLCLSALQRAVILDQASERPARLPGELLEAWEKTSSHG